MSSILTIVSLYYGDILSTRLGSRFPILARYIKYKQEISKKTIIFYIFEIFVLIFVLLFVNIYIFYIN